MLRHAGMPSANAQPHPESVTVVTVERLTSAWLRPLRCFVRSQRIVLRSVMLVSIEEGSQLMLVEKLVLPFDCLRSSSAVNMLTGLWSSFLGASGGRSSIRRESRLTRCAIALAICASAVGSCFLQIWSLFRRPRFPQDATPNP